MVIHEENLIVSAAVSVPVPGITDATVGIAFYTANI